MRRLVLPYAVTLTVLWLVPAMLVLAGHLLLPDSNPGGQCEGIGFGCAPAPNDGVVFLGFMASPFLVIAGLVGCVAIALVRAFRQPARRATV